MARARRRLTPARDLGPGGVGDGLPADDIGAPLLHRWFVVSLLVLVPVGVVVVVWAFLSIDRPRIEAAARRPPGTEAVTHERGDATLNRIRTAEPGPGCASGVTLVGDDSARATSRVALEATCGLLARADLALAAAGLDRLERDDGSVRLAVFELTGVDSTARREGDRLVIELNAKFQFEPGPRAAPSVVHELVHLAQGMPGGPVTAQAELDAVRAQDLACRRLRFPGDPPRGCQDAAELLAEPDPLGSLVAAGYPSEDAT